MNLFATGIQIISNEKELCRNIFALLCSALENVSKACLGLWKLGRCY